MSVLESFLHDPLVEWSSAKHMQSETSDSATISKESHDAKKIMSRIQDRWVDGGAFSLFGINTFDFLPYFLQVEWCI